MSTRRRVLGAYERYVAVARDAGLVASDETVEIRCDAAWYMAVVGPDGHRRRAPGLGPTGFLGRTKAEALSALEAVLRAWADYAAGVRV